MKIAVIFLLFLGLINAVYTNPGNSINAEHFNKFTAAHCAPRAQDVLELYAYWQNCPESEKSAVLKILIGKLIILLKSLAIDLQCKLSDLLAALGLPADVIELILGGNTDELIQKISVDSLVKTVFILLEGLFANLGLLFKDVLLAINTQLGSTLNLASLGFIHNTLAEVSQSVSGSVLATVVDLTASLLATITGILSVNTVLNLIFGATC